MGAVLAPVRPEAPEEPAAPAGTAWRREPAHGRAAPAGGRQEHLHPHVQVWTVSPPRRGASPADNDVRARLPGKGLRRPRPDRPLLAAAGARGTRGDRTGHLGSRAPARGLEAYDWRGRAAA